MSQIANIVVFDGASTPVSHTLVPVSVVREGDTVVAEYREALAALPVEAQVRLTISAQKLKSGVVRTSTSMVVPVMESIAGNNAAGYTAAPRVAFEDRTDLVSYAHPRSTITSRRLARMLTINVGNNVSTSVAAATAGPVCELIDQLISPT